MKIVRNKFLTKIERGKGLELRIPTKKFDDLIGTSDEGFPKPTGRMQEEEEGGQKKQGKSKELIYYNGMEISIKDMCEFSDMSEKTFHKSIENASTEYVSLNKLFLVPQIKIYKILRSICFINFSKRFAFENSADIDIINAIIHADCGIDLAAEIKQEYFSTISRSSSDFDFARGIIVRTSIPDISSTTAIEDLRGRYNDAFSELRLFDLYFNEYRVPEITTEKLTEALKKVHQSTFQNKDRNINFILTPASYSYLSTILKLSTWKNCVFSNIVLQQRKNGQIVQMDCRKLISEETLPIFQKMKSVLQENQMIPIKTLQEILMNFYQKKTSN
jgi:hypothetical protein